MRIINPSYKIEFDVDGMDMLRRIEVCGRLAHKSEDRITDTSCVDFVKKIMKLGHLSVIEHASFSVRFICNRGKTHESVRHRLMSPTQESSRYCSYNRDRFGNQVTFIKPFWVGIAEGEYNGDISGDEITTNKADLIWFCSMLNHETDYFNLIKCGWKAEQARGVLPIDLKTEIIITANLREWRHIFTLRAAKPAHPQMRELMTPLLNDVKKLIPVVFDDIKGVSHFD
jgi:thymidylate synthase (FAD)